MRPARSTTTALYRRGVPAATVSGMCWVIRYGAWSTEPRVCQAPLPVWAAKTTRSSCPPSVSAWRVTVPVAPAAGAWRVTVGLAAAGGQRLGGLVDDGGTGGHGDGDVLAGAAGQGLVGAVDAVEAGAGRAGREGGVLGLGGVVQRRRRTRCRSSGPCARRRTRSPWRSASVWTPSARAGLSLRSLPRAAISW